MLSKLLLQKIVSELYGLYSPILEEYCNQATAIQLLYTASIELSCKMTAGRNQAGWDLGKNVNAVLLLLLVRLSDRLTPGNIQISARQPCYMERESPSMAKGVRLRLLSLRGSWVQIPPPASLFTQSVRILLIHACT